MSFPPRSTPPGRALLRRAIAALAAGFLASACVGQIGCGSSRRDELLHVSYDPTRELFLEVNQAFVEKHRAETGRTIRIRQSHGGSGSQARAVLEGLPADVTSLALFPDTDAVRKVGLLRNDWVDRFPKRSLPFTSTLAFLVRKGNPKKLHDWTDLVRDDLDIEIVAANPKTSGAGKLAFLAAWGSCVTRGGSDEDARKLVKKLYAKVKSLDGGARGASTRFTESRRGDVLLTWENEAWLDQRAHPEEVEIVLPRTTVRAEPHVAVIDSNVRRNGTEDTASAYVDFLYTKAGQEIIAKHYYRPTDPETLAANADRFPAPAERMFTLAEIEPDWNVLMKRFFDEGGEFDRVYEKK